MRQHRRFNGTDFSPVTLTNEDVVEAVSQLPTVADRLTYWTAQGQAALATFVSAARSLLAGTATRTELTTLGLGSIADAHGFPMLDTGEETIPRQIANANNVAIGSSGDVRLTYWRARKTESITQVAAVSGSTAAGATPTLAKMGFYSVAANGDLTLEAACASDTALFAATGTRYARNLTSTFNKVAGNVYAFGVIVVSGATIPTLQGLSSGMQLTSAERAAKPRSSARRAGQTDLPSSILDSALSDSNLIYYAEAIP